MKAQACVLCISIWLTASNAARAEVRAGVEQPDHAINLSAGWQSTWLLGFAYTTTLPYRVTPYQLRLDTQLKLPMALIPYLDGGQLGSALSALWRIDGHFAIDTAVALQLSWANSDLGFQTSFGSEIYLRPGYFRAHYAIMFELGWRSTFATWIRHSQAVKDLFDDRYDRNTAYNEATAIHGPEQGVAGFSVHRFMLGLAGAIQLHSAFAVSLRGGADLAPQKQGLIGVAPLTPLPFYLELSGRYQW